MTESEQVKAALAALADTDRRGSTGLDERHRDDADNCNAPERTSDSVLTGDQAVGDWPADADYRAVIERAVAATGDLEAAAAFVESVGLDGLETAVERAEHEVSGLADEGRQALVTLERFRVAAAGPVEE